MYDFAHHVLGHIVSTELARDILRHLVYNRLVQVFEGTGPRNNNDAEVLLDPDSDDVRKVIQQAFEDADEHDCTNPDTGGNGEESECLSTDTNGKGKQKTKTYSFRWTTFHAEPLSEDKLVSFLNNITDRAFAFANPKLTFANSRLGHRVAGLEDKSHAIPVSYKPDGEDMRPDFLLLPFEAFTDGFETVDINFAASRLVGESQNKDLAAGVEQMQRYARGLKRAQPWVHYVLGMTITKDKAVFLHGDGSGMEHLELTLGDGRGCIEFIRILLGLALVDNVDLGHNPDVLAEGKEQVCTTKYVIHHSVASSAATSKGTLRRTKQSQVYSVPNLLSRVAISEAGSSSRNASAALCQQVITPYSTCPKRVHSEIVDDGDEGTQSKKRRTEESPVEEMNHFVLFPVAVYRYEHLGMLFTTSSIRGRGATVFCVMDIKTKDKLLALKMPWQDLGRVAEQDAFMEHLTSKPRSKFIVPLRTFKVETNGKTCTTLGAIRGFNDDQIGNLCIENRMLMVSASELKRPVKYFWGVHDFVRGLRGALLGHEYLTTIGILHRDINENNIVLGLRPGDERGYLIDFDMAIPQKAEESTPAVPATPFDAFLRPTTHKASAVQLDNKKVMKILRTGTFPYISYNVLLGGRHTHFDDIESFLYVLLLFFFSYAGPLSDTELRKSDENGFVQSIGSGRLAHMRDWPQKYADLADGNPLQVAGQKISAIMIINGGTTTIEGPEFVDCLENNWSLELRDPIRHLIVACFTLFWNSTLPTASRRLRTEVSHAEFISILDQWLDMYSDLEDQFSNCPFKQAWRTESS